MHFKNPRTRRKLFWSLATLTIVLAIAAIGQFAGIRPNSTNASTPPPLQGRAVFGEPPPTPAVEAPKPVEQPPVEQEPATRARLDEPDAGVDRDIDHFLSRWKQTILDRNAAGHSSLYAPRLETFFSRRNVTRDVVRREKARMMDIYPKVNRYVISEVKLERSTPTETVISLRKEWDMEGDRRFAGAERQRLKLKKMYGDWKIVSEQEQKVYWIRRG